MAEYVALRNLATKCSKGLDPQITKSQKTLDRYAPKRESNTQTTYHDKWSLKSSALRLAPAR